MKRLWLFRLATLALAFSMACEGSDPLPSSPDDSVGSPVGSWELTAFELDDTNVVAIPDPGRYTLRLDGDGRANLRTDCNLCSGSYELDQRSLSFGSMACTLAACLPGSLELPYRTAVESVTSFELRGGELLLRYDRGVLRLRRA